MTDVFISYAREDQAAARMVATEVIRLGYRVWWDEDLPAHVRYGDVIAERIAGAKAVIVLWSQHSVDSEWVRAEADRGREARKLIQTVLDAAAPPMPFSQIQVASLAGWQAEPNHPGWRRVRDSLAALSPLADAAPPASPAWAQPPPSAPATPTPARGMSLTTVGALLIALLLLAAVAIGMMTVPEDDGPERPERTARGVPPAPARSPGTPVDPSGAASPPVELASPLRPPSSPIRPAGSPTEIIPHSSLRQLSAGDLAGLSATQLRLARNEIYARRGRIFRDADLRRHFARYPWYRPVADEVELGPIEAANVRLIQRAEASR